MLAFVCHLGSNSGLPAVRRKNSAIRSLANTWRAVTPRRQNDHHLIRANRAVSLQDRHSDLRFHVRVSPMPNVNTINSRLYRSLVVTHLRILERFFPNRSWMTDHPEAGPTKSHHRDGTKRYESKLTDCW